MYSKLLTLKKNISYTAKVLSVDVDPSEITATTSPSPMQPDDEKPKDEKVDYYKVQLIDENSEGIEDCIKVVSSDKLK